MDDAQQHHTKGRVAHLIFTPREFSLTSNDDVMAIAVLAMLKPERDVRLLTRIASPARAAHGGTRAGRSRRLQQGSQAALHADGKRGPYAVQPALVKKGEGPVDGLRRRPSVLTRRAGQVVGRVGIPVRCALTGSLATSAERRSSAAASRERKLGAAWREVDDAGVGHAHVGGPLRSLRTRTAYMRVELEVRCRTGEDLARHLVKIRGTARIRL